MQKNWPLVSLGVGILSSARNLWTVVLVSDRFHRDLSKRAESNVPNPFRWMIRHRDDRRAVEETLAAVFPSDRLGSEPTVVSLLTQTMNDRSFSELCYHSSYEAFARLIRVIESSPVVSLHPTGCGYYAGQEPNVRQCFPTTNETSVWQRICQAMSVTLMSSSEAFWIFCLNSGSFSRISTTSFR